LEHYLTLVSADGFQMPVLRQAAARWRQLSDKHRLAPDKIKRRPVLLLPTFINAVFTGVKLADKFWAGKNSIPPGCFFVKYRLTSL